MPAARPYAEAMFSILRGRGGAADVLAELEAVVRTLEAAPVARNTLVYRGVNPQAAGAVLTALTERCSPLVANLLRLLAVKGRVGLLADIVQALRTKVDAAEGRIRARMEIARPIDAAQEEAVAQALGRRFGGVVEMRTEVRPELIGGARVTVGDRVLDGSLSGQLVALRRALMADGS